MIITIKLFFLHSLDAAVLITVLNEQPNMGDCLNPSTPTPSLAMQSLRIREGLLSALLHYQTQVIIISRYGKPLHKAILLSHTINVLLHTARWL